MKNKKGFTLIEILVVVSIIGFLTTIVLVSLNSAKEKAQETAGIQQLKEVKNAINMFYSDNGYYPEGNIDNLESVLSTGGKVYISEITDNPQLVYFGTSTGSIICNSGKCPNYSLALWDLKDSGMMVWQDAINYCASKGKRLTTIYDYVNQNSLSIDKKAGVFVIDKSYITSTEASMNPVLRV